MKYADEADVLNIAMFGMTARQWREQNPDKKGNIRDYALTSSLRTPKVFVKEFSYFLMPCH